MKASKINEIMLKIQTLPYEKILFNGPWGIGKTKHVLESIENQENIYYISLFGKKDINTFYEELYYLLSANYKVTADFKRHLRNLKKLSFSIYGFNISVPLVADMLTSIQKQLSNKSNIIIIIDDLERKSDSLEIKEIFGFIDSISKNEGIKIVLVASADNLEEKEKDTFKDYAEKSIDRIYEITTYSDNAPQKIIGKEIWPSIKDLYINNELTNLRTLEKTSFFIKEVIKELVEVTYNDKFTREDLYKICAAVIIYVIDYKKGRNLTTESNKVEGNQLSLDTSDSNEEKPKEYIWHTILQGGLYNSNMNIFINFILNWFVTGDFSKKKFDELFTEVNTYKESKTPLFMSDYQLQQEINEFTNFLKNLDENISPRNFMVRLDEIACIAEATDLELNYSIDEVVEWLLHNSKLKGSESNTFIKLLPRRESNFLQKVIAEYKLKAHSHYSNQLLSKMIKNLTKREFNRDDTDLIRDLKIVINNLKTQNDDEVREKIINEMKNNQWFLPFPYGEISHSHWTYCHDIFSLIRDLVYLDYKADIRLKEDAMQYFKRKVDDSTDQIFKYRLNSLLKQYLH